MHHIKDFFLCLFNLISRLIQILQIELNLMIEQLNLNKLNLNLIYTNCPPRIIVKNSNEIVVTGLEIQRKQWNVSKGEKYSSTGMPPSPTRLCEPVGKANVFM